jgi:hypothetical protein
VQTFCAHLHPVWRAHDFSGHVARESRDSHPPEILVQAIWQQQRILRDQLRTLDGQTVRVLHPGFKNHEAGPDFRGAVVQIGSDAPRTGDVEIDLIANGWRAHGHEHNPAFQNVVLHVLWEGASGFASGPPAMELRHQLDATLEEISAWLGRETIPSLPDGMRGKCCAPLCALPAAGLEKLLHQAAQVRWRRKASQLQARARQAGWEQTLWEGLFRALGYKQNVWPMQRLAELRPIWFFGPGEAFTWQARLLGISGLLPEQLTKTQSASNDYLRRVWDQWWREREQFQQHILPRNLWKFNSLRPANHPQRRLALAAHWLASGSLIAKLETWFTSEISDTELPDSLLKILQVAEDDFWSWRWTFLSARLPRPQPMLGESRVTDLAVNVILPWFWVRAVEGKNNRLRQVAEHRYLIWPSAQDNSALKLARERLLGSSPAKILRGAAAQQGLLQIVRDFCEHSNAICEDCRFPELVRDFAAV